LNASANPMNIVKKYPFISSSSVLMINAAVFAGGFFTVHPEKAPYKPVRKQAQACFRTGPPGYPGGPAKPFISLQA
jgi:hypothetical protein